MRLVRTILAFAIAASLVMLPLGASAAGFAMLSGHTHSSMQMDPSSDMSMDCCPDDVKGAPSHTNGHKCNMGICCVGGIVALEDVRAMSSEFLPVAGSKVAIPADQIVSSRHSSPPFRPPRV
jgi:hypothetical protein